VALKWGRGVTVVPNSSNSEPTLQDATDRSRHLTQASGVGLLLAAAFEMRARGFSSIGLTHFDEGVYAFSGFWPFHQTYGAALYPWQKFFAPPGYFGLIGIVNWLAGKVQDHNAIGINLAFGSLTVLVVFWSGRRFFGECAGVSAAALVAFSEFHIAFSRTALTDTGFSFFFFAALALTAICVEKESLSWAVLAGLAAGAAWNYKYHGWLAVAFAFLIMCMEGTRKPASLRRARMLFRCWTVILVVSTACILPWMLYVQYRLNGYAAIEEFHAGFANFRWMHNLRTLAQMQWYFDGWMSRSSPAIAFALGTLYTRRRVPFEKFGWYAASLFFGLLLAGAACTGLGACILLAALAIPAAWRVKSVFARLLLCALLALFVLTPCYTPYARLMLPWSLMVMVLAGYGLQTLLEVGRCSDRWERFLTRARRKPRVLTACLGVVATVALCVFQRPAPRTWMATTSARDDTAQMVRLIPAGSTVFVVGEPEIAFYFKQARVRTFCTNGLAYRGEPLPHPFTYVEDGPIFVVGGYYGRKQWGWDPALKNRRNQFRLVARLTFQPGDVRLLDDYPPQEARGNRWAPDPRYDLLLYEFLPGKPPISTIREKR
jgi:4-amino-4-deoxy-L-arabinose transferase-like glycosyltransferase